MRFAYFNDTNKIVSIHPATLTHGCECDMSAIKPQTVRYFELPDGTFPWVKMWEYTNHFQILVSPHSLVDDDYVSHEPLNPEIRPEVEEMLNRFKKLNPHNKEEK